MTWRDAGTSVYGTTLRNTLKQLMTSSFPQKPGRMIAVNFFSLVLDIEAHVVSSITAGCFSHCYCCAQTDSELWCASPDYLRL